MPKLFYQPTGRKAGEPLWMDWQQSRDRSVCRGDPAEMFERLIRPFESGLAQISEKVKAIEKDLKGLKSISKVVIREQRSQRAKTK